MTRKTILKRCCGAFILVSPLLGMFAICVYLGLWKQLLVIVGSFLGIAGLGALAAWLLTSKD